MKVVESGISTPESDLKDYYDQHEFYIGLGLAISSSVFIGSSFIVKKKALLRLNRPGNVRAGSGGFGYLRDWLWWLGFLTMGVGEAANFAAYAFAPASLVTPLGALSVLIAAILSSKYLKERLNLIGKLGCFLCILGSTVIVIHSPKEEEIKSLEVLMDKIFDPIFMLYVFCITVVSLLIVFYYGPKYGRQNVVVYIIICSAVGSLSVMACKGLGIVLKESFSGNREDFENWFTYVICASLVLCVCVQMNYLNKALDLFNTSIVTPIYYVFFTTLVIVASTILFREWQHLSGEDILGNVCGFLIVIVAIFLLHAFKDMNISLADVKAMLRPRPETQATSLDRHEYCRANYGSNSFTRNV